MDSEEPEMASSSTEVNHEGWEKDGSGVYSRHCGYRKLVQKQKPITSSLIWLTQLMNRLPVPQYARVGAWVGDINAGKNHEVFMLHKKDF